jgi:hypothetical protein
MRFVSDSMALINISWSTLYQLLDNVLLMFDEACGSCMTVHQSILVIPENASAE